MQPRYSNRIGWSGNKHVDIVQKILPLQPKTSSTIVQTSNFRPILPDINNSIEQSQIIDVEQCDVDQADQIRSSPKSNFCGLVYFNIFNMIKKNISSVHYTIFRTVNYFL